jgi:hypothetical protein
MKNVSKLFTCLALAVAALLVGIRAEAQVASSIRVIVRNNGTGADLGQDTLYFGVNSTGTNGIDAALGEEELPPVPPSQVFDIRWSNVPGTDFGEGVKKNFRAYATSSQSDTFKIKFQAGSGGYPVTISWPSGLSAYFGTAVIKAGSLTVNMLTATSISITDVDQSTATIYTTSPTAPATGVSITGINFGVIGFPTPGQATDSVTITNSTASAVTVDSVVTTNTAFTVLNPPSFPQTIASNGSLRVGVLFSATGNGSVSGLIKAYHNGPSSPASGSLTAIASNGEGLYFDEIARTVYDNRAGMFTNNIGIKYSNTTPLQGLQFKITIPNKMLKVTKVDLGSSITSPTDWQFDYEISRASNSSEVTVILYGNDSTINLPAGTYDSLFVVRMDIANIKVCNDSIGGDQVDAVMSLGNVKSALATSLGESAGVGVDDNRDTTVYTIYNSSSRGDVNCDDRVDILDLLMINDASLGRISLATWQRNRGDLAPWSLVWQQPNTFFTDGTNYGDGLVNIQDVVLFANAILNEAWPDSQQLSRVAPRDNGDGADISASVASPNIYDVKFTYYIDRDGIRVKMNNVVPVKGFQMKLNAVGAPADLQAQIADELKGKFLVQTKVVGDEIRVIALSLSGDPISPSDAQLLQFAFTVANVDGTGVIEPITAGGTENEPLKVEYEVIRATSGVAGEELSPIASMTSTPNPSKGATTLGYTLAKPATVTVSVIDARGHEVSRLVDGLRQDAGQHDVRFDAAGLPSGTYFWTLTTDGVIRTQRVVIAH